MSAPASDRRRFLRQIAGVTAAGSVTAIGATTASAALDGELVALGAEFERLLMEWYPLRAEETRLSKVFDAAWRKAPARYLDNDSAMDLRDEVGYSAAIDAANDVLEAIDPIVERIGELKARSFAGLAVKARAAQFACFHVDKLDVPRERMDWEVRFLNDLTVEIQALAAGGADV